MQISCTECGKNIDIPDSKVPKTARFSVRCPHCGLKTSVDKGQAPASAKTADRPAKASDPEIYPPEAQVAFIYIQDRTWKTQLEQYFRKKGGFVSSAGDSEGGVRKLQLNRYDVIVLEDDEHTVSMQQEINSWPGVKRRDVNYLLIGETARSFDPQEAFVRGVNAYLNRADMSDILDMIAKAEATFDQRNKLWYLYGTQEP